MSQLTAKIQDRIDRAHQRIDEVEHSDDEVSVVQGILDSHELLVEARLDSRKLKADGWQIKGVIAQLTVLEQAITEAFHRAIV